MAGLEFKAGKLIVFGPQGITVTKGWPPLSWRRTPTQPWRHEVPRLAADGRPDRVLARRLETYRARYFVSPSLRWLRLGGGMLKDHINEDTTVGIPFEDGWHSPIPGYNSDKPPLTRGALRKMIAATKFQLTIPERARVAVRPFHFNQHAALLGLLARGGGPAYDLVASNPGLALALANLPLFIRGVSKRWRSAKALLKHRQRHIAARLGFSGGEAMVKLLRRIKPAGLQAWHLLFLRTTMDRDPDMAKVLSHLRRIGSREIVLSTHERMRATTTPAFLQQVSELQARERGPFGEITDTLRMGRQLYGAGWRQAPFLSLTQLRRQHDHLAALCARQSSSDVPFDEPPVPGNDLIRPLRFESELRLEGDAMRNCVGSYSLLVRQGEAYLYHLDLPGEACTLSLSPGPGDDKVWHLRELKAFANQRPSPLAKKTVLKWLQNHRQNVEADPQLDIWEDHEVEWEMNMLGLGW